jgi:predicted DsbA family dithiol-disulfide isomerase
LKVSTPIKVDIWSDVQCPWCYIGKRKFEDGAAQFGGEVEVEYHSFELAPDTPVDFDGSPKDFLSQRKGIAPDQVDMMLDRVTGIAKSVGLDYDYDHVHQTNTIKAHELLHFAELATTVGLDRDEVVAVLEAQTYLADVKADVAQAEAYGIQGVPFFVIDGKYGVSGAQEAAAFAQVLEQARSERDEPVGAGQASS